MRKKRDCFPGFASCSDCEIGVESEGLAGEFTATDQSAQAFDSLARKGGYARMTGETEVERR